MMPITTSPESKRRNRGFDNASICYCKSRESGNDALDEQEYLQFVGLTVGLCTLMECSSPLLSSVIAGFIDASIQAQEALSWKYLVASVISREIQIWPSQSSGNLPFSTQAGRSTHRIFVNPSSTRLFWWFSSVPLPPLLPVAVQPVCSPAGTVSWPEPLQKKPASLSLCRLFIGLRPWIGHSQVDGPYTRSMLSSISHIVFRTA
jgi:hypothetical protein